MALNRKRNPRIEALTLQAAADVQQHMPHVGAPQQPQSEAEYVELQREQQNLERVWDAMEQSGAPLEGFHVVNPALMPQG